MPSLQQITQADRERIEAVPLDQRRTWKKQLAQAAQKFNDDGVIQRTADARRNHIVDAVMGALPHVREQSPGVYSYYQSIHSEETAALQPFFTGNKDFESFVHALATEYDFKPIAEWDPDRTKALIREKYNSNIHIICGMAESLVQSGELDRATWVPIDQALRYLSDKIRIDEPDGYLSPNGSMGFDWNTLRRQINRAIYYANPESDSHKLLSAIFYAAERSGIFPAIKQIYGDTSPTNALIK